jgi:hypothetical protein
MSREDREESRDVAWWRESLSVQDLERVGEASGREGLRRTRPRCEKLERPRRADGVSMGEVVAAGMSDMVGGGLVHGVASSWASMINSMLASPQGASEQYMWIWTSSWMVKRCVWCSECSLSGRWRIQSEVGYGGVEIRRHWSRRKRLNARIARTSACQSCKMLPCAEGSLL